MIVESRAQDLECNLGVTNSPTGTQVKYKISLWMLTDQGKTNNKCSTPVSWHLMNRDPLVPK